MPEQLCFINQRRPQGPRLYQQGMQGAPYSYYHNNQSAPIQPWYTPTPPSWSTPPNWPYHTSYHPHLVNQPFQQYVPQQTQWNNPSKGWRPQQNQPPALMPPPQPKPHLTHVSPPRLPKLPGQSNPNSNKRQAQQAPSGETSYPAYAVEIEEVNIRLERVLLDNHPPSPPVEVEEENE